MKYTSVGARAEAIDVTTVSWAMPTGSVAAPIGIYCNAATTITGALVNDTTETSWVLAAGVMHPLSFRSINTSSTTKNGYKVIYP